MRLDAFMDLALYDPVQGYYERSAGVTGRSGDYYTSVSVGPLLGRLLAEWVAGCADSAGSGTPVHLLESGAHDGRLASDLLSAMERFRPELLSRMDYTLIEPSSRRRGWQEAVLGASGRWPVRWVPDLDSLGSVDGVGILLTNELLDAFPARRFVWCSPERCWRESGVGVVAGGFDWADIGPARDCPEFLEGMGEAVGAVLPDGFTVDLSCAAVEWWGRVAVCVPRGWLLALDYGFSHSELFSAARGQGSLRGYRAHQRVEHPLAAPGLQDLTCHVAWDWVAEVAEGLGWTTERLELQGRFLTRVAGQVAARGGAEAEDLARQARALQTLTHPGHLGASFQALIQSRGVPVSRF